MPRFEFKPSDRVESSPRCALCLAEGGKLDPCACGTLTHAECLRELGRGRCPTMGCSSRIQPAAPVPVPGPMPAPVRPTGTWGTEAIAGIGNAPTPDPVRLFRNFEAFQARGVLERGRVRREAGGQDPGPPEPSEPARGTRATRGQRREGGGDDFGRRREREQRGEMDRHGEDF